jgi:endoglucanase
MPIRHLSAVVGCCLGLGSFAEAVCAAPIASPSARVDVVATSANILMPGVAPPIGSVSPMDWLPADAAARSLTVSVPIHDFSVTDFEVRFSVSADTEVKVDFLGPWQQGAGGVLRELTVQWNGASFVGGKLSGFKPGTAWHDQRISATFFAKANEPIVLRCSATVPESLRDRSTPRPRSDSAAFQLADQFRRGANLGNFLEVPPGEDWGDNSMNQNDYRIMKEHGFDHVRIPVGWHHYCGPAPDYEINQSIIRKVNQQLDYADRAGIAAIVNIHHFDAFINDPVGQRAKLRRIWQQVATLLKDRPTSVALEILNEPSDAATTEVMNEIYADVIPLIRTIDTEKAIFVGPGQFNQASELSRLKLPSDDRLIVSIHSYTPHYFTHQGAPWSAECDRLRGIPFPGPPAKPVAIPPGIADHVDQWLRRFNQLRDDQNPGGYASITSELKLAADWGKYWNRPIHLGEFGAYMKASPKDRAEYYRFVRSEATRLGMGWCIWDWKAGFAYWDRTRNDAHAGLRDALFP